MRSDSSQLLEGDPMRVSQARGYAKVSEMSERNEEIVRNGWRQSTSVNSSREKPVPTKPRNWRRAALRAVVCGVSGEACPVPAAELVVGEPGGAAHLTGADREHLGHGRPLGFLIAEIRAPMTAIGR